MFIVQVAEHHDEVGMLAEHADSVFEMPLTSVTTVRAGMPSPRKYIPLARLPDLVDETVSEARFEAAKVRPVTTVPDDTAVIVSVVLAMPPVPAVNDTVPSDDVIVVPSAIVSSLSIVQVHTLATQSEPADMSPSTPVEGEHA